MKKFWRAFWCTGAAVLVIYMAMTIKYPSTAGIHKIPPNVALIEGECVVVNWDATEEQWVDAFIKWQELKRKRLPGHGLSSK